MMAPTARLLIPLLLPWLCSCRIPGVASSLPSRLDRHFLNSNLQITGDRANGSQSSGSAVLIGPRLLATARHVWSTFPECQHVAHRGTKHTRLYWPTRSFASTRMRVVCEGQGDSPLDDWVLLEPADIAQWPADADECVAHIMPREQWNPGGSVGPIWLTGYPNGIGTPLPSTPTQIGEDALGKGVWMSVTADDNTEDGPWVITGAPLTDSTLVSMRYNSEWEPPLGASGGGMYSFNHFARRAELTAIFVQYEWNLLDGARLMGIPIWNILAQLRQQMAPEQPAPSARHVSTSGN